MSDDHALLAYQAMAPIYDSYTHRNDYETWLGTLLTKLEALGLRTGKLLDVACGTGRAFDPMLSRGWEITACDIAPAMVNEAALKYPDAGVVFDVRDCRGLPVYAAGGFSLVWALNDALNYLLADDDLQLAVESMGANLADDGLLVFDLNTLKLFSAAYESPPESENGWTWEGNGKVDDKVYEAELSGDGFDAHLHRERYWSVAEVQEAVAGAGLEHVVAMGQREEDGVLTIADSWDEAVDDKIVHVTRRPR